MHRVKVARSSSFGRRTRRARPVLPGGAAARPHLPRFVALPSCFFARCSQLDPCRRSALAIGARLGHRALLVRATPARAEHLISLCNQPLLTSSSAGALLLYMLRTSKRDDEERRGARLQETFQLELHIKDLRTHCFECQYEKQEAVVGKKGAHQERPASRQCRPCPSSLSCPASRHASRSRPPRRTRPRARAAPRAPRGVSPGRCRSGCLWTMAVSEGTRGGEGRDGDDAPTVLRLRTSRWICTASVGEACVAVGRFSWQSCGQS